MRRFLNRNVLFVDLCHAASRQVCSLFNRQRPSRQRRRKGRGRTARRLSLRVEQCERRLALDATAGDGGFLDVVPGWGSDSAGVVVETVDGGALSIMLSTGSGANFAISDALTTGILSPPIGSSQNTFGNPGRITLQNSGLASRIQEPVSATATSASVTSASVIIPGVTVSPAGSVTNSASAVESTFGESSWWNAAPTLGGPVVPGNDFLIAPGNEGLVITADDLSLTSVSPQISTNNDVSNSADVSGSLITYGEIASPITNNLPRYTQTVDTAPQSKQTLFRNEWTSRPTCLPRPTCLLCRVLRETQKILLSLQIPLTRREFRQAITLRLAVNQQLIQATNWLQFPPRPNAIQNKIPIKINRPLKPSIKNLIPWQGKAETKTNQAMNALATRHWRLRRMKA